VEGSQISSIVFETKSSLPWSRSRFPSPASMSTSNMHVKGEGASSSKSLTPASTEDACRSYSLPSCSEDCCQVAIRLRCCPEVVLFQLGGQLSTAVQTLPHPSRGLRVIFCVWLRLSHLVCQWSGSYQWRLWKCCFL
jgi:hypothetical protein